MHHFCFTRQNKVPGRYFLLRNSLKDICYYVLTVTFVYFHINCLCTSTYKRNNALKELCVSFIRLWHTMNSKGMSKFHALESFRAENHAGMVRISYSSPTKFYVYEVVRGCTLCGCVCYLTLCLGASLRPFSHNGIKITKEIQFPVENVSRTCRSYSYRRCRG